MRGSCTAGFGECGSASMVVFSGKFRWDGPVRTPDRMATVTDPERINEITRWIVDCQTDDALFARLG